MRVPRQGKGKEKHNIKYCFVEFNDESTCESTKDKLAANPDFAVDFVGDKSKNRQEKLATGEKGLILSLLYRVLTKEWLPSSLTNLPTYTLFQAILKILTVTVYSHCTQNNLLLTFSVNCFNNS